jgi:hypothetical protein
MYHMLVNSRDQDVKMVVGEEREAILVNQERKKVFGGNNKYRTKKPHK